MEIAAVPARRLHFPSVRCGKLQGLDRDDVLLTQTAGDFGSRHDRAGRAVADAAAVEEPERIGDHRRAQHLLHRHFASSEEHTSELQSLMRISYDVFSV